MHSEQHRDADEERAEHDLEQALVDPREPTGTDARTDDRPRGERDRRSVPHLARHAVGRDARDADRDDRAERDRVRVTLGIGGPEHEQRHHDDAPTDAQEPRQETAAEPDRDRPLVLCAQGPAPRAVTSERYRDELGLALIPGTGPLAVVVPGAFGGWIELLREHGTLPLRDVLHFAIGYAEDGYPALASIGDAIRKVEQLFQDDWTTSADLYVPAPEPGTLHRNRVLAETYRRILAEAEAASTDRDAQLDAAQECWYRGFVAEEIVRFQEREWLDSSGERHAGLLAEDDLRDWAPSWEEPLSVNYHGYEVFKAGPWSQAPVFLQQLRLLEGFDLGAMGHASAEWVHTI